MDSIFLIEKGWIDPIENRNADGYKPFGFKLTEQEAKDFCESQGYWTAVDCWSIRYKPNGKMWKYRYTEIHRLKEVINAQEVEYDGIVEPEKKINMDKAEGKKLSLLSYDELEDTRQNRLKKCGNMHYQKIKYGIFERVPSHGREPNGLILGPFDTKEIAQEAGEKWGYSGDNYFVDIYKNKIWDGNQQLH
jgi:hypothetical protein